MEEQYFPRFAGDRLPSDSIGQALSIAEKLDTLIGIFGVGEIPSGDKDPFALRRAAVGVLRIMIEGRLGLDLCRLLKEALKQYELKFEPGGVVDDVYRFMMDRLRAYYQDAGLRPDVIESVMSCSPTRPYDFDQRVRAVRAFRKLPQAESLAAANKRIRNILRQAGEFNREAVDDAALLREAAEVRLLQQLQEMEQRVQPLFASGDYSAALSKLAGLREAVDAFFDDVMVMVDDQALREARLRLLNRLSELFLQVADVSKLQG
jgi:glycyl-tRNA synthetase beta chain